MEATLLSMLERCCGASAQELLQPNCDLLDSGFLDSLARIEWLNAIADQYHVDLQPTQIPPEVWRSAAELLAFTANALEANGISRSVLQK